MSSFSTALTTVRRTPYQALMSILMLTMTFFVINVFAFLMFGAHITLQYFEGTPEIIAFFKLNTSSEKLSTIEQQFKQKQTVREVIIVTQEEALAIYRETNKEEPLLLELVSAEILPASIEVSARNIQALPEIQKELQAIPEIEEVQYQEDIVQVLQQWTNSLRFVGIGIIALLCIISFLILVSIITMKATGRRNQISIMRLIGATRWYIAKPFIIEGMLYGLCGALVGWGLSYGLLLYFSPWLTDFLRGIITFPVPPDIIALQAGVCVSIGILFGGWAGYVGVNRQIRH